MTAIDINSCTVSPAREAIYLQGETEEGGKVSREHQQVEGAAENQHQALGEWQRLWEVELLAGITHESCLLTLSPGPSQTQSNVVPPRER